MAKRKTLDEMTIAELEADSYRLSRAREMLRKDALAVQAELSRKVHAAELAREMDRLAGKFPDLAQTVAPDGIESAEAVNGG